MSDSAQQAGQSDAAVIAVSCMKIQVCDTGLYGCGRIIENVYKVAQICDYRRHPEWTPPLHSPYQNAPYMRCTIVAEVTHLPSV